MREDELDRIAWVRIADAYGPAVDVPKQLCSLAAGAEGWRASLEALEAGVFHQGGYFSATPHAARFLVDLAATGPEAPRAAILGLLARMHGAHTADAAIGWDPYAFRSTPAPPDYPEATATIEAIEAGAGAFRELLTDESPSVRAGAAYLLSGIADSAGAARAAIAGALSGDRDEAARASQALALARLADPGTGAGPIGALPGERDEAARASGAPRPSDPGAGAGPIGALAGERDEAARESGALALARLAELSGDGSPLVRGAAAVGLAWLGRADRRALAEAAALEGVAEGFPWADGSLALLAVSALGALEETDDALCELVELWLGRGPLWSSDPRDDWNEGSGLPSPEAWQRSELLRAAVGLLAPRAFAGFAGRERDPVLAGELSAGQRRILGWCAVHGLAIPAPGIPWIEPCAMRRFLEGGGPLDEPLELEGRSWPRWRWLYGVADGIAEAPERVIAALRALEPEALFDLCVDVLSGAYAHPRCYGLCLCGARLAELLAAIEPRRPALRERFERYGLALAAEPGRIRAEQARFALGPSLPSPPAALDALVAAGGLPADEERARAVLAGLPVERRSAIVGRMRGSSREAFFDLCDLEIVARCSLDDFLSESWDLPGFTTEELLLPLGDAMLASIGERIDRARGRKRDLLESIRADLAGELTELAVEIEAVGSGLQARVRDGAGRELCSFDLPPIPKQADLAPLAAVIEEPGLTRLQLAVEEALDGELACRIEDLIAALGVREIVSGGHAWIGEPGDQR
ncbi:MAG: hypothetical protein JXR96_12380 [Deltaproteobacteria bacterium]|nr:hypothetical protein [Deltaproteobacteria bacterium]